ncbi:MAG: MopE-related protein, partial [Myxococcota bacterium]
MNCVQGKCRLFVHCDPSLVPGGNPTGISCRWEDMPNGPSSSCCGRTCADFQSSNDHCGACNNRCASGTSCQKGTCVAKSCSSDKDCTQQHTCKQGQCVPRCQPTTEVCGDKIDNDCDGKVDESCTATSTVRCGNQDIDLKTNSQHCGACNNACAQGTSCHFGRCLPPKSVGNACQSNADCPPRQVCADKKCFKSLADAEIDACFPVAPKPCLEMVTDKHGVPGYKSML